MWNAAGVIHNFCGTYFQGALAKPRGFHSAEGQVALRVGQSRSLAARRNGVPLYRVTLGAQVRRNGAPLYTEADLEARGLGPHPTGPHPTPFRRRRGCGEARRPRR